MVGYRHSVRLQRIAAAFAAAEGPHQRIFGASACSRLCEQLERPHHAIACALGLRPTEQLVVSCQTARIHGSWGARPVPMRRFPSLHDGRFAREGVIRVDCRNSCLRHRALPNS